MKLFKIVYCGVVHYLYLQQNYSLNFSAKKKNELSVKVQLAAKTYQLCCFAAVSQCLYIHVPVHARVVSRAGLFGSGSGRVRA